MARSDNCLEGACTNSMSTLRRPELVPLFSLLLERVFSVCTDSERRGILRMGMDGRAEEDEGVSVGEEADVRDGLPARCCAA